MKLQNTWRGMIDRCYNPRNPSYKYYGGRGIKVCPEWKNSYKQFCIDMGEKPTSKHSIDRIDNDNGYSKNNCRWATKKQQANNKRQNYVYEENFGILKPITYWDKFFATKKGKKKLLKRARKYSDKVFESLYNGLIK